MVLVILIDLFHNPYYITILLFFKTKLSAKQGSQATPLLATFNQMEQAGVASLRVGGGG
jgi:hypothetical protein